MLDSARIFALLGLLPAGSGCSHCGPWNAVPVEDPDGAAASGEIDIVRDAILQLAEWTERDETCVSEARLEEKVTDFGKEVGGLYNPFSHRVRITADSFDSAALRWVTLHEFCHAIDDEEGWPSRDEVDLLAPYGAGLDPDLYKTDKALAGEVFAKYCAMGPGLPAIYEALSESCAEVLVNEAALYVNSVVYPSTSAEPIDRFTSTTTWTSIPGTEREGDEPWGPSAVGAQGYFFLDSTASYDDEGNVEFIRWVLLRIDPITATVVDSLFIEEVGPTEIGLNTTFWVHSLIGSTGDPILHDARDGRAWRVRSSPLALEEIAFPTLDEEDPWPSGFENDGVLLLLTRLDDRVAVGIADLDEGLIEPALDDDIEEPWNGSIGGFTAGAEGVVVQIQTATGLALVGLDWSGAISWIHELAFDSISTASMGRLADGSVIFSPYFYSPKDQHYPIPLRLEPETGAWSVPAGDCSVAPYLGGATVYGGRNWQLASQDLGDGSYGLALGDLRVE